jgi:hypothetical protein
MMMNPAWIPCPPFAINSPLSSRGIVGLKNYSAVLQNAGDKSWMRSNGRFMLRHSRDQLPPTPENWNNCTLFNKGWPNISMGELRRSR